MLGMMVFSSSSENTLNIESLEYQIITSLNFRHNDSMFKYAHLFYLYVLALAFIIMFIIAFRDKILKDDVVIIKVYCAVIVGWSLLLILASLTLYFTVGKHIFKVNARLKAFNDYVNQRIHKKLNFLKLIEKPSANIIEMNNVIKKCLKMMYTNDTPTETMAKAFYTLTLYNHYHKLTIRNASINDAFVLFKSTYQVTNTYNPAAYLQRYGTYIEDINSSIIMENIDKTVRNPNLENALLLCNKWTAATNEAANTIYPEDALNAFGIIAFVIFALNIIAASGAVFAVLQKLDI
jgi:hypothetical protein